MTAMQQHHVRGNALASAHAHMVGKRRTVGKRTAAACLMMMVRQFASCGPTTVAAVCRCTRGGSRISSRAPEFRSARPDSREQALQHRNPTGGLAVKGGGQWARPGIPVAAHAGAVTMGKRWQGVLHEPLAAGP